MDSHVTARYYLRQNEPQEQPSSINGQTIVRRKLRMPTTNSLPCNDAVVVPMTTNPFIRASNLNGSRQWQKEAMKTETDKPFGRNTQHRLYHNIPISTPKLNRYDFFNSKMAQQRFMSPQQHQQLPSSRIFRIKRGTTHERGMTHDAKNMPKESFSNKPETTVGGQRQHHEKLNEIRQLINKQWENMDAAHSTGKHNGPRHRMNRKSLQPFQINDQELMQTKRLIKMQFQKRAPTALDGHRQTSNSPRGVTENIATQSSKTATALASTNEQATGQTVVHSASKNDTTSMDETSGPKTNISALEQQRQQDVLTPFAFSTTYTNLSSYLLNGGARKPKRPRPFRESMGAVRGSLLSPISFDPNYNHHRQYNAMRSSMQSPQSNDTAGRQSHMNLTQILTDKGLGGELTMDQKSTSPRDQKSQDSKKLSRQFRFDSNRPRKKERPSSILKSIISMTKKSEAMIQMNNSINFQSKAKKLPAPSLTASNFRHNQTEDQNSNGIAHQQQNFQTYRSIDDQMAEKIEEMPISAVAALNANGNKRRETERIAKSMNLTNHVNNKVNNSTEQQQETSKISPGETVIEGLIQQYEDLSMASEVFDPTLRGSVTGSIEAKEREGLGGLPPTPRGIVVQHHMRKSHGIAPINLKELRKSEDNDRVSTRVRRPSPKVIIYDDEQEMPIEAINILEQNSKIQQYQTRRMKDLSIKRMKEATPERSQSPATAKEDDDQVVTRNKNEQQESDRGWSKAVNTIRQSQDATQKKQLILKDGQVYELDELYSTLKFYANERKQLQNKQLENMKKSIQQMAMSQLKLPLNNFRQSRDSKLFQSGTDPFQNGADVGDNILRTIMAMKEQKNELKSEAQEKSHRIVKQLANQRTRTQLTNAQEGTRQFFNDLMDNIIRDQQGKPEGQSTLERKFSYANTQQRKVKSTQKRLDARRQRVNNLMRPVFTRLVEIWMNIEANTEKIEAKHSQQPSLFKIQHLKRQMTSNMRESKRISKQTTINDLAIAIPKQMVLDALQNLFNQENKKKKSRKKKSAGSRRQIHRDIGEKYRALDKNQFRNDLLRHIADKKPAYIDHLRVLQRGVTKDPDLADVSEFFRPQVSNRTFYQQVKKQHLSLADELDKEKNGIMKYYDAFTNQRINQAIDPSLIRINDRTLYLCQRKLTIENCKAISNFLSETKQKENKAKEIVIDSCEITDEGIAMILQGIVNQVKTNRRGGKPRKQYLHSFVVTNSCFGPLSLQKLMLLNEDLLELKLSNIKSTSGFGHTFLANLLNELTEGCPYLFKLSLTRINMNNESVIESLLKLMQSKELLQLIDLSGTSITPNQMNMFLQQLLQMPGAIRDLNLSYNSLQFQSEMANLQEESILFVDNLINLIEQANIMTHLQICGMNFDRDSLTKICEAMAKSTNLYVVNMSDNSITIDNQYFIQTLAQFGIDYEDIPSHRNKRELNQFNPISSLDRTQKQSKDLRFDKEIDFQKVNLPFKQKQVEFEKSSDGSLFSQEALLSYEEFHEKISTYFYNNDYEENKQTDETKIGDRKGSVESTRQDYYTNHVVKCYQMSGVKERMAMNHAKQYDGQGRSPEGKYDQFLISRIINHPELIFNDKPYANGLQQSQLFSVDAVTSWQLASNTENFISDRYRYIMVFYERGLLSKNEHLQEIQDKDILYYLKNKYQSDQKNQGMSPIICGSLVGRRKGEGIFERKQRFLLTSLFALLSVIDCYGFVTDAQLASSLKQGIITCLQSGIDEIFKYEQVKNSLRGWRQIINDMAFNNEQVDTMVVNFPDMSSKKLLKQEWYTFAGFFPPGYHQILIYDPLLERAYAKDVVVGVNRRSFIYHEYPTKKKIKTIKVVPDMWVKWNEDTVQDLQNIFIHEAASNEFDPHKIMRKYGEEEIDKCLAILKSEMKCVMILQRELLSNSPGKYPQISWEATFAFMDQVQSGNSMLQSYKKIQRMQVELCFIGATRTDESMGLKSALQRSELLDFLLRLCKEFVKLNFDSIEPISNHLPLFIQAYIKRITSDSVIEKHRRIIRESTVLNEFLFDNHEGLYSLFQEAKKIAHKFFDQFKGLVLEDYGTLLLTGKNIEDYFIFSQMSIWNEHQDGQKYGWLEFIEFQELLCRIALNSINSSEPVAKKVFVLVELIYNIRYEQEIWSPDDQPLYPLRYPKPAGQSSSDDSSD